MKYICKICGYIYDDDKEKAKFDSLPDSWKCPVCGAPKSSFEPLKENIEDFLPGNAPVIDTDLIELTPNEMSVIFSSLAKGEEKQYNKERCDLFNQIADYFKEIAPKSDDASVEKLIFLIRKNLENDYPALRKIASENQDRGTLRICTWGEKVTNMLSALLKSYISRGSAMLEHTDIWVCTVCGFVYIGENPPKICPVCKVPDWKFEKIEGRS